MSEHLASTSSSNPERRSGGLRARVARFVSRLIGPVNIMRPAEDPLSGVLDSSWTWDGPARGDQQREHHDPSAALEHAQLGRQRGSAVYPKIDGVLTLVPSGYRRPAENEQVPRFPGGIRDIPGEGAAIRNWNYGQNDNYFDDPNKDLPTVDAIGTPPPPAPDSTDQVIDGVVRNVPHSPHD